MKPSSLDTKMDKERLISSGQDMTVADYNLK